MVGTGGASLVSFSLRLHTDGPGSYLRYLTYRLRALVRGASNSGMFWLYIPDYHARVDAAGYARVANGFDTYIFESLAAGPGTTAVVERTIGVDAMDCETGDLEWRQFGYGLRLYARRRAGGAALAARRRGGHTKARRAKLPPVQPQGVELGEGQPRIRAGPDRRRARVRRAGHVPRAAAGARPDGLAEAGDRVRRFRLGGGRGHGMPLRGATRQTARLRHKAPRRSRRAA